MTENGGKAALLAIAIAGSYWMARQEVYRRYPEMERRPPTAAEVRAFEEAARGPELLRRIDGWGYDAEGIGLETGPDGKERWIWRVNEMSRFREDWWAARELRTGLLRTAAFIACLAVMLLLGGLRAWGFDVRYSTAGAALCALASVSILANYIQRGDGPPFYASISWLALVAANLPVGFFEEACFRGLLFQGLAKRFNPRKGAFLSSCAFAFWHWGAQDPMNFPAYILYGMACCGALASGLGLVWLSLAHAAVDVLAMRWDPPGGRMYELILGILGAYAAWRVLREAPKTQVDAASAVV
ncbi:MAG: CPBP family intramembrane metalloprotease [Elusimicrobia bacterium]|nr:CPBP family intramembrane metalloprotease [Elusimicrobiota bacterium]